LAATPINYFLERLARSGPAFVVQIGANDGISGDPVRSFVERYRWPGILVEPLPDVFAKLERNYRGSPQIKLENCAIGGGHELTLYRVRADIAERAPWLHELASFDREVVLRHQFLLPDIANHIVEERVPSISFSALMDRHGVDRFDVLAIDTEGYDLEILKQVDFPRHRPRVVIYEHKHLSAAQQSEARTLLGEADYVTLQEEFDTLGLRRDWVATGSAIEDYEVFAQFQEQLQSARQIQSYLSTGGVFRVARGPLGGWSITRIAES